MGKILWGEGCQAHKQSFVLSLSFLSLSLVALTHSSPNYCCPATEVPAVLLLGGVCTAAGVGGGVGRPGRANQLFYHPCRAGFAPLQILTTRSQLPCWVEETAVSAQQLSRRWWCGETQLLLNGKVRLGRNYVGPHPPNCPLLPPSRPARPLPVRARAAGRPPQDGLPGRRLPRLPGPLPAAPRTGESLCPLGV